MYYIIMEQKFLGWDVLEVKNGVATVYASQVKTEKKAREMAEYLTSQEKK